MDKNLKKMLASHQALTHSESKKVLSHTQREKESWIINTIIIADCSTPFRYKRRKKYRNLTGARVNLTYYPGTEQVAGIDIDVMNVVRIRQS